MKLTPSGRVYGLGVILLVALTICSQNFSDRGGPYFMASLTVAGIAYLLAVREVFAAATFRRSAIVVGLVMAAVWQIAFLRLAPGADDDVHRYVWDGRLQRLGYNPYLVVSSSAEARPLHTDETRTLNNPDLPSPYPPGAQLFFRAVTAIHESAFAMKFAFFVCGWVIALLLLDLLRTTGKAHLVLAYAWNPLLAVEVAGSGHIDIVGVLLLTLSVLALARRWRMVAAIALGLAIAVKFLPIVLVPLYWKRVRIRDALIAIAVVALLYLPFLDHGHIPTGSLGAYLQGFRFNGPVFAFLDRVLPARVLAAAAVLAGLSLASWLRTSRASWGPGDVAWPLAVTLFCAPVVFPWYLLWLLPFLTSASTLLLVLWTVTIVPTYIVWHLRTLGLPWGALPPWVMLVEYGALALFAAFLRFGRKSETVESEYASERTDLGAINTKES